MTYQNLKAELKRFGITYKEVASKLGMSENNFSLKVNQKVPFTIDEMKAINETFLPSVNLDYLCQTEA